MAQNIAIVMSENTPTYVEIAEAIKRMAAQQGAPKLKFISMPVDDLVAAEGEIYKTNFYKLVVTIGARAAGVMAKKPVKPPVLNTLIPRSLYESLRPRLLGEQTSAIFLDQPVERQLELIRALMPNKTLIGVVYSSSSESTSTEIGRTAKAKGYSAFAERIERSGDFGPVFGRVFSRAELLVALPDAEIYNPMTISKILLYSYRANRPVISYSAAHVKAGALAALFTPPQSSARQIAELILKLEYNGKLVLPPPQYSAYWNVSVNRHVARLMKLSVPNDQQIENNMNRLSEQ